MLGQIIHFIIADSSAYWDLSLSDWCSSALSLNLSFLRASDKSLMSVVVCLLWVCLLLLGVLYPAFFFLNIYLFYYYLFLNSSEKWYTYSPLYDSYTSFLLPPLPGRLYFSVWFVCVTVCLFVCL